MTNQEWSEMQEDMEQDKDSLVLVGHGVYCPACLFDQKQSVLRIVTLDADFLIIGGVSGTVECPVCHLTYHMELSLW